MCNLKEKTKLKTTTIYKAVEEIDDKYYSYFAGTPIVLGEVEPQTTENICQKMSGFRMFYKDNDHIYNENMVGKCSGFEKESDARNLLAEGEIREKVLKIVLGGEIWIGDSSMISSYIPEDHIVYAGTKILSFEEI